MGNEDQKSRHLLRERGLMFLTWAARSNSPVTSKMIPPTTGPGTHSFFLSFFLGGFPSLWRCAVPPPYVWHSLGILSVVLSLNLTVGRVISSVHREGSMVNNLCPAATELYAPER